MVIDESQPLRILEIRTDILVLDKEIEGLLNENIGMAERLDAPSHKIMDEKIIQELKWNRKNCYQK